MSEKLLRQMFLIALQSTQDGEALTALRKAVATAKTAGLDAHALADRLMKEAPPTGHRYSKFELDLIAHNNALRAENLKLKEEAAGHKAKPPPPVHELLWRRKAQQCLAENLSNRERDFLTSILERGWSDLTDKQRQWLDDIWAKHF